MKRGAVLVPIFAGEPHSVIFVERARHLRRNPGQIGFPGGSAEPSDAADPARTAIRELNEELGVSAERVSIVGRLPDLEQASSRFMITPIVGVLDAGTGFCVDGEEIVGLFKVPLSSVIASGAIYEDVELSRARGRNMYALDYREWHIWGFTARILKSFVDAWTLPRSELRAAAQARLKR
jgi:8-oxo-dGTP pyrophosphatase MutT (NUDIX family)